MTTINDVRSLFGGGKAVQGYRYNVFFPNIPGAEIPPSHIVSDVRLPISSLGSITLNLGGTQQFFSSTISISGNLSINFPTESNFLMFKYFSAWRDLIVNRDGTRNYPKEFKKEIRVELLDKKRSPVLVAQVRGVWPKTYGEFSLGASQTNVMTSSIGFSYDSIEYQV